MANIDVAPTILEAARLRAPEHMAGRSMMPLLQGRATAWRDTLLYEYYWERNFPQTPTLHALRGSRYKYIRYQGIWDLDELYDLQTDPLLLLRPIPRWKYSARLEMTLPAGWKAGLQEIYVDPQVLTSDLANEAPLLSPYNVLGRTVFAPLQIEMCYNVSSG